MSPLRPIRAATRKLCADVSRLRFAAPVTHVYNPLEYAARAHDAYLRRYATTARRIVFLGMNPGPFGMAQTGVPFGQVAAVRDWLEIRARVDPPSQQHPKRPIQGFDCTRSEKSGERLWGAIADHYGTPERFFSQHFIANYCPLVFMEESGRNRTPDKLPRDERDALFEVCDEYLRNVVRALQPQRVIGIGAFATTRAAAALQGEEILLGQILHPSPANPRANRGWATEARKQLRELGVCSGDGLVSRPGKRRAATKKAARTST